MQMRSVVFAVVISAIFISACGGSGSSNSNGELPEGINTRPIETGSNATPGIPADSNVTPDAGKPTPGIPGNSNSATSVPKGATPTPGIPDPETIRKQLERTDIDPNVVNRPSRTIPNSNVKTREPLGRPRKSDPR